MERILNQKHSKETFLFSCSRLFERASYYGIRALIVLYVLGESLKMSREEAINIYALFTACFVFSQILGALLGDLVLGNKKALIIGGVIQAIGAFSLCIPSTFGLYLGLVLVVLGGGLYSPNMISYFGKLYLNKTKLLDSGFTIFYLAVNIGAFLGILLVGYLGETFGWNYGFITAGILMLISIVFFLISKEFKYSETDINKLAINERVVKILEALILIGLFWAIYEISNVRLFDIQIKFRELSALNIPKHLWSSLNSYFIFPLGIIAAIVWTYFYSNQFVKLTIGFLLAAISFGILFLSIAEIFIAPIIYSILTQYTNPKYLAIMMSLAFVFTRIFSLSLGLFNGKFYDSPLFALRFGVISMGVIGVGLLIYILLIKKKGSIK